MRVCEVLFLPSRLCTYPRYSRKICWQKTSITKLLVVLTGCVHVSIFLQVCFSHSSLLRYHYTTVVVLVICRSNIILVRSVKNRRPYYRLYIWYFSFYAIVGSYCVVDQIACFLLLFNPRTPL